MSTQKYLKKKILSTFLLFGILQNICFQWTKTPFVCVEERPKHITKAKFWKTFYIWRMSYSCCRIWEDDCHCNLQLSFHTALKFVITIMFWLHSSEDLMEDIVLLKGSLSTASSCALPETLTSKCKWKVLWVWTGSLCSWTLPPTCHLLLPGSWAHVAKGPG